jgi:hypothetical protein
MLEVFTCASAKQVRASDLLDPVVSGQSKGVWKVAGQVARNTLEGHIDEGYTVTADDV